jgi:hypothetical protein
MDSRFGSSTLKFMVDQTINGNCVQQTQPMVLFLKMQIYVHMLTS